MTLRAHPNVISLSEERQRRRDADLADEPVRFQMCVPPGVLFVGWQTEPADTPPERPRKPYSGFRWFRRLSSWRPS